MDEDISTQLRYLYTRGNSIKHFKYCTDDVKLQLFKSYCTNLYCGHIWCNFKTAAMTKIKVAYKIKLKRDTSMSECMAKFNVDPFIERRLVVLEIGC